MRRRAVLAAAVGLAAAAAAAPPLPAVAAPSPVTARGSSSAVAGSGRALADPPARAAAAADKAVASGLDSLRKGPEERYHRGAVTAGAGGMYYVSYNRTYQGLPVVGGDAVVVTDSSGKVRDTTAASGATGDVATSPSVTAESATAKARSRFSRVDDSAAPRLVVLAWGKRPVLAWEVLVTGLTGGKPSRQHVFVNARTGEIADAYDEVRASTGEGFYNGRVTIDTTASGGSFSMKDSTRKGVQCGGQDGAVFTGPDDSWGNGLGTDLETACVDALYAAQKEWDMLRDWLGRNGLDGAGGGFPARVGLPDVNAYWNGVYTNFGQSMDGARQATPIDVVAHEFGHAIFQTTPGGAGSSNENGGVNEATGDIFGALTEAYAANPKDRPDYEVGETVDLIGTGPIRYMYDPSKAGDPNCWSTAIPTTEVHSAAGPLNHWFYLLAEGSSPGGGKPASPVCFGGPSSVTGVGVQKAGKIFMGALMRKTSEWAYADVRSASMAAAVELFGAGSAECASTKAAWNAISVPAQAGEASCSAAVSDFSMSLTPTSGTVTPGRSATATLGTQTTLGGVQAVKLTASGLPAGAQATFAPASITSGGSSTMTVATSASTPAGTYDITVTGTGASGTHTAVYTLTVEASGGATPTPTPTTPTPTPTTPAPATPPDIDVNAVKAHLQQFQVIADATGGTRRSTGPGYLASAAYIEGKLRAAGYTVVRQRCASGCSRGAGPNLIADWPGGDPNQVVMAGAHLDSVSAGPGVNDNASGSASLLEVALTLAAKKPDLSKHVRFGWWTDEEQGLHGSAFYVGSLSAAERSKIKVYYNYDMVGSPNGGYFINNMRTGAARYLKEFYDALRLQPEENVEGANRSDDASFRRAGIPTSGVAAGASAIKTAAQAAKWGGRADEAYDSCYHQACDTVANVDDTILDRAADAVAYGIWKSAAGAGAARTSRNDTDYAVRDRATTRSSVTTGAPGSAKSPVRVVVTMRHACAENLSIRLRGPNGVSYLIDRHGGARCTPYGTRTYTVPVRQRASGRWILRITDVRAKSAGTLDWWSLTV